jgi:hypothetical protein
MLLCKRVTYILWYWLDYKSHFDACSRVNQWSENEKGLYLAVALRGQAQGILGDLPIDKQQDYKSPFSSCRLCRFLSLI